jgi:hypothetical protein
VPVVARDGRFVYAQVIKDVVEFLELNESTAPQLSPAALADRANVVLAAAVRLTRQMPDSALENLLPHRPRSWRMLTHHVFQIATAFLDAERDAKPLMQEAINAGPPDAMRSSTAIAQFGASVQERFKQWWNGAGAQDFQRPVVTYFGSTSRHEMLERTVWHMAQHVRQVAALLQQQDIVPDRPLGSAEIAGLPLTEKIWDEA